MLHPIKAVKKPLTVVCIQYDGENLGAVEAFIGSNNLDLEVGVFNATPRFWVAKSEAWIKLTVGMWVMAEADGSGFYPCTAEAFTAGYDLMVAWS